MATFMTLVNLVLGRTNEVLLTNGTFSSATGPQLNLQNAVNAAVLDICRREQQWPFIYAQQTLTTVIGQQEYTPSAQIRSIKWNTFGIVRNDAANPAIVASNLAEMDYNLWATRRRSSDQQLATSQYNTPTNVIKGDDGNIILSPPPKQVMTITYDAWATPLSMVNYNDTCVVPDDYNYIIGDGAMYYGYDFRGDEAAKMDTKMKFDSGIKEMQRQLIKPVDSFKSTQVINNRTFNSIPSRFGL